MHILEAIAAIYFFTLLSLFHGSTYEAVICQGHCVYLTALIEAIHYNKRSVADSREFEGCCVYVRKTIVVLLF